MVYLIYLLLTLTVPKKYNYYQNRGSILAGTTTFLEIPPSGTIKILRLERSDMIPLRYIIIVNFGEE
jgi:hypothetical protein